MLEDSYKFEDLFLSKYAQKNCNSKGRMRKETPCPLRLPFQRDRDRILHSKAFRRLKHKTQVFISPEEDYYRTRLTHTLEVSQIARTIARALLLNEDLTEAIALGHDLGHTPFGHSGERILRDLTGDHFNHAEQSLRVVDILENDGKGLNLTYEVRNGILNHNGNKVPATLEGQIVKYADRIAYINHDIEDAIRAGFISEKNIPQDCVKVLGKTKSQRIQTMIFDIIKNSKDKPNIIMSPTIQEKTEKLRKEFLNKNVYRHPIVLNEEKKAHRMLEGLFNYYMQHTDKLDETYQNLLKTCKKETVICDYIASMSDTYAVKVFESLYVPRKWSK